MAWKYKAYMQDYGLEKETRAPQRNNTRLRGSCCKHCLSVIDHLSDRKVIDAITRDVNEWCNISLGKDKYVDPSVEMREKEFKANQYDWNVEDILKNYLTTEQFNQYMSGTKLVDLDLDDETLANIESDVKNMRSSKDFRNKTELEKQFQDIRKRGRRPSRPDVKLKVNLVPKEDKSNM